MKRLSLMLVLLSALCFAGACTKKAVNKVNLTMASWQDHHYSDLLASWGPPQQVLDDGFGGRVLVFLRTRSFTRPGTATTQTTAQATQWDNMIWGQASSTTTYTPAQTYSFTAYRMFFINQKGIIYRWSWRGL